MENITNKIIDILVESGTISKEERNLYHYCVEGLIEISSNLILTIIFGFLIGKIIETILFLLIIIPLRSIVGGYHAESGRVCFVLSILFYFTTILSAGILNTNLDYKYSICIYVIFSICIMIISPVDCKNKRLKAKEKKRNKKICILLMFFISIIFAFVCIFEATNFCFLISCCLMTIFLLLILGTIKNKLNHCFGVLND